MKKIIEFYFLLLCASLYSSNNEVQKIDETNNKESLQSTNLENNFFSVERGFIYSTGTGLGTGFFLNSKINHILFRPYYIFAINNIDFLATCMILMIEDYNISKKVKYSSSYIGIGINWHIINLSKKIKYLSSTMGIGGRFYLSTNLIGDLKFYSKLPYVIEPYIFFEFSTKKAISYLNIYSKIECLFIDTFNISFDFGIRYNLKSSKGAKS
ncbi:hypothetical protein [Borrelia hermsii]|nr:hypothetical protein [Borrelia hermsii]AJW73212.1 hypothetical protein L283_01995 [Borrelia hermsii CC1]AMR75433.1 hypothetical protein A0V01_02325 [Borrelia hermsii]ANA43216.1 hypothetical protein AXX13_01995 [Borrelia hermsii HS1]UEQ07050.1 hypothetical protein LEQ40_02010 [Borrelia hermsii]UPA07731.1 hypothetical protein bhDAH_000402 [Borrelia hermsii DAH]